MVRSPLARPAAALLAFVWITAPLATVIHGIAAAHRYCAEHRGFEESGQPDERDPGSLPSDERQEHLACAFHVAWVSDQTLHGPDLQGAPLLDGLALVIPVTGTALFAADVLATAPKTSPPVRAV